MENYDVVFRRATLEDDVCAIARYIYLTDPFIYPSICDSADAEEWVDIISQCYRMYDNLFSYKNLFLALMDGRIVGICCMIPGGKKFKFNESLKMSPICSSQMEDVINKYFYPLLSETASLDGYNVVNLCVDERVRGLGIGKALLSYCINECEAKIVYLDVISYNIPAIKVYKSLGFKIEREYEGFSGEDTSVLCYQMKKSIE